MENLKIFCPSCSKEVVGNYCHHCGEKITSDKIELSTKAFMKDAIEEISSMDSKLIRTLKYLIIRPGFLTNEMIAGRRNLYIKPFRLYVMMVVFHFLVFNTVKSGDFFNTERFPLFVSSSFIQQIVHREEVQSKKSHDDFSTLLNQRIKDNLTIILYLLVFIIALFFKGIYPYSGRYYIEHLYFVLHLMSFSFTRNIVLMPLIILNWMRVAFVVSAATQVVYLFIALKNVYPQRTWHVIIKTILVLLVFIVTLLSGVLISLFAGLYQLRG